MIAKADDLPRPAAPTGDGDAVRGVPRASTRPFSGTPELVSSRACVPPSAGSLRERDPVEDRAGVVLVPPGRAGTHRHRDPGGLQRAVEQLHVHVAALAGAPVLDLAALGL